MKKKVKSKKRAEYIARATAGKIARKKKKQKEDVKCEQLKIMAQEQV
jgi:DNA-binding transcriptional regulator YdaS (Cro superfamily)